MKNTTPATNAEESRPCKRCQGTGQIQYASGSRECGHCRGVGHFPRVDVPKLIEAIFTKRGGNGKLRFRASFPSKLDYGTLEGARAYYVWRLARFHGGADVCLPITADMVAGNDSYRSELDVLAEIIAKRVFGTDMAAAYRWGGLLGFAKGETPKGLPAAAYEGGPVADENNAWWEAPELR